MRRRVVVLHPSLLAEIMRGWPAMTAIPVGTSVTSDAPEDIRVVGCYWDDRTSTIRVAVESEAFDELPEGVILPEWSPTYTRHYDEMSAFEAAMRVLRA